MSIKPNPRRPPRRRRPKPPSNPHPLHHLATALVPHKGSTCATGRRTPSPPPPSADSGPTQRLPAPGEADLPERAQTFSCWPRVPAGASDPLVSGMASPELCAGLNRCVVLADPAASDAGVLPLDAVHEILLRLPAKELCRLRAVCRSWRSLLSDPLFAADHAARHPEPLIILGYNTMENGSLVKIMDLSGHIVKQVRVDDHRVMSLPLNLACVRTIEDGSCRLVNPATAAMYHVRENLAKMFQIDCDEAMYLFGQVASTREYKAFRKVTFSHVGEYGFLYEICTLSGNSHARWRPIQGPPNTFGWSEGTGIVIDGVAHFLIADVYLAVIQNI
ncbi:hypothetical protein ACP70R_026705 [Stipagrostis hirtigluma subsp. patula]